MTVLGWLKRKPGRHRSNIDENAEANFMDK
jgi:hypothetical protein